MLQTRVAMHAVHQHALDQRRLWICALMPSRFMRSSWGAVTWSRWENDQRNPLIGCFLFRILVERQVAAIVFSISTCAWS